MDYKRGRPRLDDRPGFAEHFCRFLPALYGGNMTKAEAAKRLGISHRSLNRYLQAYSRQGYGTVERR